MSQPKYIEDAGRAIWAHWGLDATAPPEDRKVVQGELTEAMKHIKATTGKITNIMEAVLDAALLDRDSAGARNGVLAWTDFVEELEEDFPELTEKWLERLQAVTMEAEKKRAASEAAAELKRDAGAPPGGSHRMLYHKLPIFSGDTGTMGAWLSTVRRKLEASGFSLDSMDAFSLVTAALGDAGDLFWVLYKAAGDKRENLETVLNDTVSMKDAGEKMRCFKAMKELKQGNHSLSWLHRKFSKIVEVMDKYTERPMPETDKLFWFTACMGKELYERAWRDEITSVIDLVKHVAMRGLERDRGGSRALLYYEDQDTVARGQQEEQEVMAMTKKPQRPPAVCFSFRDIEKCRFGNSCEFDHRGQGKEQNKRECHSFTNKGVCRWGDRCRYSHDAQKQARSVSFAEDDEGEYVESFAIARTEELMQVSSVGSTGTLMDSGAGANVTSSKAGMSNLRPDSKVYSLADVGTPGAKKHRSSMAGDKMFRSPDGNPGFKLTDVSVVETLGRNIMSVSHACDQGKVVLFTRDGAHIVKERDAKEVMQFVKSKAVAKGLSNGNLYELNEPKNQPPRLD